jgi:uncharacterized protein (DUF433 family)
MDLMNRITVEPGKCGGRPCIRGYRFRVSDLLEPEDISAAMRYAARLLDHPVITAPTVSAA